MMSTALAGTHRLNGSAPAIVAVGAITVASITMPFFGLPLAAGTAAYALIAASRLDMVLRGRVVSRQQRHRIALCIGLAILLVAGLFSGVTYGLRMSNALEARLHADIEAVNDRLELGQVFQECSAITCASAQIVRLPGKQRFGVARLSGFALADEETFGWGKRTQTGTASQ